MSHLMIDIETLGTGSSCVIVSVGAVPFVPNVGSVATDLGKHWVLPIQTQLDKGRTIDEDTLRWWFNQSNEAQKGWETPNVARIIDFWAELKGMTYIEVWSHGAGFDITILENLFCMYDLVPPWQFWNIRDTRTIFHLNNSYKVPRGTGVYHNALDDAITQAKSVCHCWKVMNP